VLRRSFGARDAAVFCRAGPAATGKEWVHVHLAAGWADEVIDQCVRQPFDLAAAPLARVHILTSPSEPGAVVVFVAHHLLVDGASFDLLTSELLRALITESDDYVPVPQPELPPEITPRPADPQLWRQVLKPLPEHNASLRTYRSQASGAPDTCIVKPISADFMDAVDRTRSQLGCSVSSVLFGLYSAAALRVLDIPDLLMMTQIDVRNRSQRNIMGMMINTIPVRASLDDQERWADFLARVSRRTTDALGNRHVPLQDIMAVANPERRADRSSVFTDFEFTTVRQWEPPEEIRLLGIPVRVFERPDPATRYGLSVNVALGHGGAHVRWAAKSSYYDPADVDLLQQAAESLAADMGRSLFRRPATADIMPSASVAAVRALGTGQQRPVPLQGWMARLSEHCARIPDAPAIRHGGSTVSYAQLGRMITGIIRELTASGISPGDRVAIRMARGSGHVAALLAVLQVGAAYIPIDRANPPARVADMLAITAPKAIITDDILHVPGGLGLPAQVIDISTRIQRWQSDRSLTLRPDGGCDPAGPADVAYVLFTSGSTGVPKGVEVGLGAFVNHLLMMEETLGLDESQVVGQTAPLAFDVHVWQCVAPLLAGGAIAVYDEDTLRDPRQFVREAERDRVTVLELVPSYLSALLMAHASPGGQAALRALRLRLLLSTGESLSGDLASSLQEAFPVLALLNAYGPAEAADDVTLAPVGKRPPAAVVPIGWPERNIEMLVLDRFRRVRPPGLIGQLAIGGQSLANGYVNDPDSPAFDVHPYDSGSRIYLTGDRCVLEPALGFVHLGRSDDQVKVGGRRVELGEIDAALASIPGVRQAATIVRAAQGRSHLLAKVVIDERTTVDDVRCQASALLPAYMIPAVFEQTTDLPLGGTGKVDRKQLAREVDRAAPGRPGPQGGLAALVWETWRSVLPPDAAVLSPFFAAGGDSLRAMDLVVRLQARGVPVTIGQVYQHQDLDAFIDCVRQSSADGQLDNAVAGDVTATPRQEEMLEEVYAGAPVPVQAVILESPAALADVEDAVNALVARHPELRLSFDRGPDGQPTMMVRPPAHPAGYVSAVRVADSSRRPGEDADSALLRQAAGQLDVRAGKHVGLAALSSGEVGLVISHLVCDIIALRTLVMELDDLLAARPHDLQPQGAFSSSFLPWARQIGQRRRAGALAADVRYRSAVSVASEQGLAHWQAASRPVRGRLAAPPEAWPATVRVAEPWPARLGDEAVILVAVAAAALAVHRVTGASPVRIDLDLDGRRAFETVGVSGVGVGCFTLVSPVLIDLADRAGPGLIEHIRMTLASRPHDAAWDSSKRLAAGSETATSIAPLINVVGRSLQLGGLTTITSCRVPAGVPGHNARSDPHAMTVDVVLPDARDRSAPDIEFLVTPRPNGPDGLSDRVIAELPAAMRTVLALAIADAPRLGSDTMPDGLDLLDLSPGQIAKLLAALGGDTSPGRGGQQERDGHDRA